MQTASPAARQAEDDTRAATKSHQALAVPGGSCTSASLKHLLPISRASDKGLCVCFGLKCGLVLFSEYLKKLGILSTAVSKADGLLEAPG